ncbi:putative immunity protein [Cellulomonas algicola]|uniref:putative immunity protein n=1 Tax=Cellulomonas algicola TaxID=2071633 RepID=UPI001C3FBEE9|nr:hypothetical protein [Cellulomonas algicola]
MPILPRERDPRLITIRRGGTLTDEHHVLLARWALACAEHVLPLFERESDDDRPAEALRIGHAWTRGEATMRQAHDSAFRANAAGRGLPDPARFAALSAGQAVAVAHVAAHDLGAAAYAIRAATAEVPEAEREATRVAELRWQRDLIPDDLRDLVLDDQRRRNAICWGVFSD